MASITQSKGTSMTPSVRRAAIPRNPLASTGAFIASLNLHIGFIRLVALANTLLFLSLVWMLIDPTASMGVLRVWVDMGAPREVVVGAVCFLLLSDIFQIRRNNDPQWPMLLAVSGQAPLVVSAVVGLLNGTFTPIALYAPVGLMSLSLIGIAMSVQAKHQTVKYPAQRLVYPVLSVLMGGLGLGLIGWRDSAITSFIMDYEAGLGLFAILIVFLAWGHGQLRQNHLLPHQMARRLTGVVLFAALAVALFTNEGGSSVLGVTMNILVAVIAIYFAFMGAQMTPRQEA